MKKKSDNMSKRDKAFFSKKRKEWENKSEEYRRRYEESGDPLVVADFLKSSPYAFKQEWVTKIIIHAMQDGEGDFLRKVISTVSDKRQNKIKVTAIKSLMTVLEVDRLVSGGHCRTKEEAFSQIAQTDWGWSYDVVKNRYFRWRKKDPEIYVEEKDGYLSISAFPAKISMGDKNFPGRWQIKIYPNRETEISWTIYYPQKSS